MKNKDINLQNLLIFSDLSTEEIDTFKDELNIMRYKKIHFYLNLEIKPIPCI